MARDLGPKVMFVAGGTDLYPKLKRRQFEIEALIGLDFLDRRIDGDTIGAGATLADIASHAGVPRGYGQAAGSRAPPSSLTETTPESTASSRLASSQAPQSRSAGGSAIRSSAWESRS